ncbi:MAG: hypothetical protein ACYCY8_07080 [Burkholderiales bacterium]
MSRVGLYPGMTRFLAQRQLGGFHLRGIAWLVLVSWLFTLVVCLANDLMNDQAQSHHLESVSHSQVNSYPEHGNDVQDEDACCSMMEDNPSLPSQAVNIIPPVYELMYMLLSGIAVLQLVLLVGTGIPFFSSSPPGKSDCALIANSLWPNAPPR